MRGVPPKMGNGPERSSIYTAGREGRATWGPEQARARACWSCGGPTGTEDLGGPPWWGLDAIVSREPGRCLIRGRAGKPSDPPAETFQPSHLRPQLPLEKVSVSRGVWGGGVSARAQD